MSHFFETSPAAYFLQKIPGASQPIDRSHHSTNASEVHLGAATKAFDRALIVLELCVVQNHFLTAGKTFYDHLSSSPFGRIEKRPAQKRFTAFSPSLMSSRPMVPHHVKRNGG